MEIHIGSIEAWLADNMFDETYAHDVRTSSSTKSFSPH